MLHAGADFEVEDVAVGTGERARRWHAETTVPLSGLAADTWVVAIVRGTQGVSRPVYPIVPGIDAAENPTLDELVEVGAAEGGDRSLAFTNALRIDVGGDGWAP